jgi:hypothetical protein
VTLTLSSVLLLFIAQLPYLIIQRTRIIEHTYTIKPWLLSHSYCTMVLLDGTAGV